MKKLSNFVQSSGFSNFILLVIILNAITMGIEVSVDSSSDVAHVISMLDTVFLGIYVIELLLKFIVFKVGFFKDAWNVFDLLIVITSLLSSMSFLAVFRVLRVFRVFRSLRSLRLVSSVGKLRVIITAIGKSLPSIAWTGVLLLIIYYIFSILGTTLFAQEFPDWFGDIPKSMYTLFQVMTLESWSMGISRPVMEVFSWAWIYFVPFVLASAFIVMNVVVGIVVNTISEVATIEKHSEESEGELEKKPPTQAEVDKEIDALKVQLQTVQTLLEKYERGKG